MVEQGSQYRQRDINMHGSTNPPTSGDGTNKPFLLPLRSMRISPLMLPYQLNYYQSIIADWLLVAYTHGIR
ncbi:hypothetical protein TNCV_3690981 [Trichonephila clavipes]|nr:hypothetical protein TNCV_3690981 [Trichonephila clavipes]